MVKSWKLRFFHQEGKYLYYYEDTHFRTTSDSQGHIDLTSITAIEAIASQQKKDKAKLIQISTKFGRAFLLREPGDDARKAQEWITQLDDWRKWLKDGGSDSPPLQRKSEDTRASRVDAKPLARGFSGTAERMRIMAKKSAQGMGTLLSTTVAKGQVGEDEELPGIKKCGWLVKKGQKRWFALKDGNLLWFKEAQTTSASVTPRFVRAVRASHTHTHTHTHSSSSLAPPLEALRCARAVWCAACRTRLLWWL